MNYDRRDSKMYNVLTMNPGKTFETKKNKIKTFENKTRDGSRFSYTSHDSQNSANLSVINFSRLC